MKPVYRFNIDLDAKLAGKISDLADSLEMPRTEVIRRLLVQAISDPKPLIRRELE